MVPQRTQVGALGDPDPEFGDDRGRLRPEEDVDPAEPRGELPGAEDHDAEQQAEAGYGKAPALRIALSPGGEIRQRPCGLLSGRLHAEATPRRCASDVHSSPGPRP